MPSLKTYDLFISHAWKHGGDYDRLINLLNEANNFSYRNYSAPEDKPLDIIPNAPKAKVKDALDRKIRPVNAVLVVSGMYYNHREWMQYELEKATELGKPIIAIYPWGAQYIPTEVLSLATVAVRWNTDSIVDAIRMFSI